jgi:hypothetical protein
MALQTQSVYGVTVINLGIVLHEPNHESDHFKMPSLYCCIFYKHFLRSVHRTLLNHHGCYVLRFPATPAERLKVQHIKPDARRHADVLTFRASCNRWR